VCGAAAEGPGGQTLGVADGVALHLLHMNLPSVSQNATASGCDPRKVSSGVGAGTTGSKAIPKALEKRRDPSVRRTPRTGVRSRVGKPKFECDECTKTRGRVVDFSCKKNLERHVTKSKVHNAPPIAICTCKKKKAVRRRDEMKSHRRYCRSGIWIEVKKQPA
jgi:hypothetical protein